MCSRFGVARSRLREESAWYRVCSGKTCEFPITSALVVCSSTLLSRVESPGSWPPFQASLRTGILSSYNKVVFAANALNPSCQPSVRKLEVFHVMPTRCFDASITFVLFWHGHKFVA